MLKKVKSIRKDFALLTENLLQFLEEACVSLAIYTPLTITERHAHVVKDFPQPEADDSDGLDATVSEGWLDLKVKNDTGNTFQIEISIDHEYIYGRIFSNNKVGYHYELINGDKSFFKKGEKVYERVSVFKNKIDDKTKEVVSLNFLHTDICEIGYALPEGTIINSEVE